jgi:hypothetical protein
MSEYGQPTNEPGQYNKARVARLKPIREAIQRLNLPPIRWRKLNGILNALEMQIEDGGDSPEANGFLLEALRAGVRHQVGSEQAAAALVAIATFEQAERKRLGK